MAKIKIKKEFNTVQYSGSLIQTKISEPADGSFIIWNWDGNNYLPTVRQISNIYSTITEDLDNVASISPTDNNQVIILKYDSNKINKTEANVLKKELQAKFSNNKIELKPSIKRKVKLVQNKEELKAKKKIDLQNAMQEYLQTLNLSSSDIDTIIKMDEDYNINLDLSKEFELGDFSIRMIELTNFLAFAPHTQIIDLDKDGIIGIGGKNRVGKSSVLKAIMFALYNSSPDNNASLKKLINKHNRDSSAEVKLYLSKAGRYYRISRRLIPKKKEGVTTELEFIETDEFLNEIKNLTGEKRQDTEKEIQKYFGIESAFEILSLYSAQKRQQELIDCKNSEKLLLVNRFIGLQNYELKGKEVGDELKLEKGIYQSVLKDFNQSIDITSLEASLTKKKGIELSFEEDILDLKESRKIDDFKHRHLISNYELNKKLASKAVENPEEVKVVLEKLQQDNLLLDGVLELHYQNIKRENLNKESVEKQFAEFVSYYKLDYEGPISKYKIDYKALKPIEGEIAVLEATIKKLYEQKDNQNCDSCGNPLTEKQKSERATELAKLHLDCETLKNSLSWKNIANEQIDTLQDTYADLKDSIEKIETEIKSIKSEQQTNLEKIENLKLKSKDWDEVQDAKERLVILEKEYQKFVNTKKDNEKTLDLLIKDSGKIKSEIQALEKDIANYHLHYNKLQASEERMRILKLYKDVINKDGLPLYILQSKIADINEQVNLIVSQVFDFEVEFSITDGDLNIEFFYENDEEKNDVGFASGSETFIINLCIKVGLSQISELPKLTSLLIDEGYGTLDADTIAKIPALFNVLPEYYKNIITISHIEELKDLYQAQIKLEKVGKYTEVTS